MSILKRIPQNTNFLHKNKFKLVFPKVPNVEFFCQNVIIPGISQQPVIAENPFNKLYVSSIKTEFEPLVVNFLIDEDMKTWFEVYNWIMGITFPHSFEEYGAMKKKGLYSDISIIVLSNNNIPNINFTFYHAFPLNMGALDFSSASECENQQFILPVVFRYDTYIPRRMT